MDVDNFSTYTNSSERSSQSASVAWKHWCRLCSKDDIQGNINIFTNQKCHDQTSDDAPDSKYKSDLAKAIEKYFLVKIQRDDEVLPQMICMECFSLVTSLMKFSQQIIKAQEMFNTLQKTAILDLNQVRLTYELLDEDRYHIVRDQPQVHFFETKQKINELHESLLFEADLNSVNPLEVHELEVKEVNLDAMENNGEDDDRHYFCDNYHDGDNEAVDRRKVCDDYDDRRDDGDNGYDDGENEEDAIQVEYSLLNDDRVLLQTDEASPNTSDAKQKLARKRKFSDSERKEKRRDMRRPSENNDDCSNKSLNLIQIQETYNFPCSECPRKFKRSQPYCLHMKRAHGKQVPARELKCDQCNRIFNKPSAFESHLRTHLPPELKKTFPCPYCEAKFTQKSFTKIHIRHTHMDERPFVCEDCGLAFRTISVLKEHRTIHTDYAPFECETCHSVFKSLIRLRAHMVIHGPKHICPICGLKLNTLVILKRHLIVHTDEMPYKCNYCERDFKHKKTFRDHLLTHNPGLHPYACDFCDRTYATSSTYLAHKKKVHPEELAAQEAGDSAPITSLINVTES